MAGTNDTLILGAVAYDPKVVTIWDGFKLHFDRNGLKFDYILFTNYESQVEAHFAGVIDVAWHSPLAWIESLRLAERQHREVRTIAMRDTDMDLISAILVRTDGPVHSIADLKGKRVGVGAHDSPQATMIPLLHLAESGLEPGRDFEVVHHDVLAGKHGDHIGGERDAARALIDKRVDAACVLDLNTITFAREGTLPVGSTRVLAQTGPYDHCNFTVLDGAPSALLERFRELLLLMKQEDPLVRPLLDMEGLRRWMPGRTSGYDLLDRAVRRFHSIDEWLAKQTTP